MVARLTRGAVQAKEHIYIVLFCQADHALCTNGRVTVGWGRAVGTETTIRCL